VDLSSFLFDIRKDCLYCDHKSDSNRKSYRTVLHILFQHLIRRLAPIIVFTAEEAWTSLNKSSSIHTEVFLKPEPRWSDPELFERINKVREIRKSVTIALEIARENKLIGSSLQGNVILFDHDNIVPIKSIEFWKEIAITSDFRIENTAIPGDALISDDMKSIGVIVEVAEGKKCERCWKISTSTDDLCERCRKVLAQESQ
jgi:isoleucyl-tRNA synthetase